ncbi:helix-turn-helix domain-containing protein [Methylobacterium sp.]|uniref:helix-turn-helix domain-containing protein n=1 Tax=Methylobacterium sp. TaxID=409 RepID=UPI003AFF8535
MDLAALTLDQVHGASLSIDQEIATDISSVREVVSRILAQWAEAGLVELRRGAVEIIDRGSLASAGRR